MTEYIIDNNLIKRQTELTSEELKIELDNLNDTIRDTESQIISLGDYKANLINKKANIEHILTQLGVEY